MTQPNDRHSPTEEFSTWLDAIASGTSTPEVVVDADLAAVQVAAHQFHGLDDVASQHALAIRSRPKSWEDIMSTNVSTMSTSSVVAKPAAKTRTRQTGSPVEFAPRAWMSAVLVAILIAGLAFGTATVLDRFRDEGNPPPEQTTIPFAGFADDEIAGDATPVPMGESSSIPYPNAANCTVTPMTRDEVVAHLEAANVATEPEYQYYEQRIVPSEEDTLGIMSTFRMHQACNSSGLALTYSFPLETPWFTANHSRAFWNWEEGHLERSVSDERIQEFADIALLSMDELFLLFPLSTPDPEDLDEPEVVVNPDVVPLPDDATPVSIPSRGIVPTIFPENIEIVGPDHAVATAVFADPETGVIAPGIVLYYDFVKVDGTWLLADYEESGTEGRG